MGDGREFKIKITTASDSSGARQTAADLGNVSQKTEEAGKSSEDAGISHRALHMIFRQVGEGSKSLEVGLMALSGIMMGSLTFGVMAVGTAMRALVAHFEKQKEVALEAAKATVQFWTDALQGNADARKAAVEYAGALQKIIDNVDTLKQKEGEEEAVLKRVLEQRLKILDAERQAAIALAHGDREEEARVNARFGQRKSDIGLQNEQAEINLKKKHLAEQSADAMGWKRVADAAERAKEAGAPGREEANAGEAALPKLKGELAKLQAARMKPEDLAALKAFVAKDVELLKNGDPSVLAAAALGIPQAKVEQLKKANQAEQAYSAAQQEYEQRQGDVERFKTGTAALAKAVEEATAHFNKAVEAARATGTAIGKDEAVHGINVDAARTIRGVKDRALIEGAGGSYRPASQKVLDEARAMAGTSQGQSMSGQDTAYFNGLLAAARGTGKEAMFSAVVRELKDMHVDDAKKWAALWEAIKQIRKQAKNQASPP